MDLLSDDVFQMQEPDSQIEDSELEAIRGRLQEMEEEEKKLKRMHEETEELIGFNCESGSRKISEGEKIEIDARSVFVSNVDYGAMADALEKHFHGCGPINRVTIQLDKFSGNPKGFAYIEFENKDSVNVAMALDGSVFCGRPIKVFPKRTNKPGISSTNRPFRGRGFRYRRPARVSNRGGYGPIRRSSRGRTWGYPY